MSRALEIENAYEAGFEDAARSAGARRQSRRMPQVRTVDVDLYDEGDHLKKRFWNQEVAAQKQQLKDSKRKRNKWINAIGTGIVAGALTAVSPPLGIAAAAATPVILDLLAPVDEKRNFSREVVRAASGATGAAIGGLLTPGLSPVGAAFGAAIGAGFAANISDRDAPIPSNFNISDKDAKQSAMKKQAALKGRVRQYQKDVRTLEKRRLKLEHLLAETEKQEARKINYGVRKVRQYAAPRYGPAYAPEYATRSNFLGGLGDDVSDFGSNIYNAGASFFNL